MVCILKFIEVNGLWFVFNFRRLFDKTWCLFLDWSTCCKWICLVLRHLSAKLLLYVVYGLHILRHKLIVKLLLHWLLNLLCSLKLVKLRLFFLFINYWLLHGLLKFPHDVRVSKCFVTFYSHIWLWDWAAIVCGTTARWTLFDLAIKHTKQVCIILFFDWWSLSSFIFMTWTQIMNYRIAFTR